MVRKISLLCIVMISAHVYSCEPGSNITQLSPNNTERYVLRLMSDNLSPQNTLYEYLGYICQKHNIHKDDVRLHIMPKIEHLRVELAPENATSNGYVPTRLYMDADNAKTNVGDWFAKITSAVSAIHDIDTLVGRAKKLAVVKHAYHMHPNSDMMTNLHGAVRLIQECNHTLYPLQYPNTIPSDAYQRQRACVYEKPRGVDKRKADAEACALYKTEVPGLMAHHLSMVIYVANRDLPYENDALPLRQQHDIVYNRWKQNPHQETLYKYFQLDIR